MGEELAVRRVITGVDAAGDASVLGDGVVTDVLTLPGIEALAIATVWQNEQAPQVPLRSLAAGLTEGNLSVLPVGGLRFLIWRMPPVGAGENPADVHQSDTIDFAVVLSGRVTLILGNGDDVELATGDCLVQGGNLHHWRNETSEPCVIAAFMTGANRM